VGGSSFPMRRPMTSLSPSCGSAWRSEASRAADQLVFFPAGLDAFEGVIGDLTATDSLQLLDRAPDPEAAARLSRSQISAALKRAHRRDVPAKTEKIQTVLRAPALGQPAVLAGAYAATVRSTIAVITVLNTQEGYVADLTSRPDLGAGPAAELQKELRKLRMLAGEPTMRTLARRAGSSPASVSRIFSGTTRTPNRIVTLEIVQLLAESAGLDVGHTVAMFDNLWQRAKDLDDTEKYRQRPNVFYELGVAHAAKARAAQAAEWQVSSWSSTDSAVAVAKVDDSVIVRNADAPAAVVSFPVEEWAAFVKAVKNGEFDVA
jgi:hypothetical protein